MHKNSDDRRAKRSRRLLKEGLLTLMQEKRFHDISARDVTESADLNRGTFYLHYPDTLALLESI
ncbi:MAG: TetR family transcriptional regulator, partial [Firmicutes bacterium]|nr:TetR family transcriptional regulator [Bacillota bacterium]